jgi:hypothetical protein
MTLGKGATVSDVEWSSDFQDRVNALRAQLLVKFAAAVAKDAVRLAPVDTGLLKSETKANQTGSQVRANTDYAAPVEFGHRVVVDDKDTGKFVPAQPYLRPAAYRTRDLS